MILLLSTASILANLRRAGSGLVEATWSGAEVEPDVAREPRAPAGIAVEAGAADREVDGVRRQADLEAIAAIDHGARPGQPRAQRGGRRVDVVDARGEELPGCADDLREQRRGGGRRGGGHERGRTGRGDGAHPAPRIEGSSGA